MLCTSIVGGSLLSLSVFRFCDALECFLTTPISAVCALFPRCKLIHLAYGHTYTYVYRHVESEKQRTSIWLLLLQQHSEI